MESSYRIEGSYYEACNCEAICPCRKQNGLADGLSTYGNSDFLLSWHIDKGAAAGVDLSGRAVGIAGRYDDNEPGSPWRVTIYIDEAAGEDQFNALANIFRGDAGGNIYFTGNFGEILGVKWAKIVFDHSAGVERLQIGEVAGAEVVRNVDFDGTVTCGFATDFAYFS